jgi:hypothetical protein
MKVRALSAGIIKVYRSQWPSGLIRRGSAAARLLELRGPNSAWGMDVCLL